MMSRDSSIRELHVEFDDTLGMHDKEHSAGIGSS